MAIKHWDAPVINDNTALYVIEEKDNKLNEAEMKLAELETARKAMSENIKAYAELSRMSKTDLLKHPICKKLGLTDDMKVDEILLAVEKDLF